MIFVKLTGNSDYPLFGLIGTHLFSNSGGRRLSRPIHTTDTNCNSQRLAFPVQLVVCEWIAISCRFSDKKKSNFQNGAVWEVAA